jgi:prolyl-tRNA synthetase
MLLLKGGFVRSLGQGLFAFLPLGIRVVENVKKILKEEMDAIGGQEVQIPLVNPYKIWQRGGRVDLVDKELVRFRDRTGRELVLSPTHEEAMVEFLRAGINSYRDLPLFLYEFQTKFRDEEKTRCGLLRTKEFMMKDGYSFHRSFSDLNNFFPKLYAAYGRVFSRCNIDVFTAEAGIGYIGGDKSFEFLMESEYGDDYILICEQCGYRANREVAVGIKNTTRGTPKPIKKVHTPGCTTMGKLSEYLNIPKSSLVKSMVYKTRQGFVMALVRGDYDVSIEKLIRFLKIPVIRPATGGELKSLDLIPGFLSPLGITCNINIVLDDTVANSANLVYGGNETDIHYMNVNFGRDYETEMVADIAEIKARNKCKQCGQPLQEKRVIELGNIFKLGELYTRAMGLSFQDDNGRKVYPSMGAYGIGIERLVASVVEANHDERGIIWPTEIAPYKAFLMGIGKSLAVKEVVEQIHEEYPLDILLDDRGESPGVKFKDADLIGLPLRIVVTNKHLQHNKVELYNRKSGETWLVDCRNVANILKTWR